MVIMIYCYIELLIINLLITIQVSGVDLRVNNTKSILKENIEVIEKNQVLSSLVENLFVKEIDLHKKYFEKKRERER